MCKHSSRLNKAIKANRLENKFTLKRNSDGTFVVRQKNRFVKVSEPKVTKAELQSAIRNFKIGFGAGHVRSCFYAD